MAINKTIEQIREEVLRIKNETVAKANTATRVGGALEDIVDHIEEAVEGVLDDVQGIVDGVQSSLSSEVSRAQAKEAELQEAVEDGLSELDAELNGGMVFKDKTEEVSFVDNYMIMCTNGTPIYRVGYKCTTYIPVMEGVPVKITIANAIGPTSYIGWAWYDENEENIGGSADNRYIDTNANNNKLMELTPIAGAQYLRVSVYKEGIAFKYYSLSDEVGVFARLEETDRSIAALVQYPLEVRENEFYTESFFGVRLADTLTRSRSDVSTLVRIGNFVPSSATNNTVTLTSSDAACFSKQTLLSCKLTNGRYKNIYFYPSGNTLTKVYDFGENVSCSEIVSMQSLHDTISGGNGIHLTPYGYRAMAQDLCNKLNTKYVFSNNYAGGWIAQYCQGQLDWRDKSVKDYYGNDACTVSVSADLKTGGNTGIPIDGTNVVNACGMIYAMNTNTYDVAYRTAYKIIQSVAGCWVQFEVRAKREFKGFARIGLARVSDYKGYDGKAHLYVYNLAGEELFSTDIPQAVECFNVDITDPCEGILVKVVVEENKNTGILINEITLHECYDYMLRPIDSNSVVAMLGSSNTQYPPLNVAQELCPDDEDNAIVERPDGTEGNGCGYFGKEIARYTGATVDNWGKSGEQTRYGLGMLDKIFATKQYSHIILSLFANDINAGVPFPDILTNIRIMAEYARNKGCIPIIVLGYPKNGSTYQYARMYDCLAYSIGAKIAYVADATKNH